MTAFHGIELIRASVEDSATFDDAARMLAESRIPAVAVLALGKVVGLFTDEELLLGLSPGYLGDLRHTAFLDTELPVLQERAQAVRAEPVRKHMRKPVTVELDSGSLHCVERFVHSDEAAIAVVDASERFVGMLSREEFAYALLRKLSAPQS